VSSPFRATEVSPEAARALWPLGESDVQWGWNMTDRDALDRVRAALQEGMGLVKCQKCGCMEETLEVLRSGLPAVEVPAARELVNLVEEWQRQLRPIQYACLGCEHCFPAVAMNVVREAFPEAYQDRALSCGFELKEQTWPAVPGEYSAFCDGPSCPVAVSTLASVELAEALAAARPRELCIVGKTETENIGIDKIVKNTIMNPTIRTLLVVGREPKGHRSGQTLLSLGANGVDKRMRVIGSLGKHPILRNVTREEVESFRRQVRIVDLIGREDTAQILDAITELGRKPDSAEPHVEEVSPQATSVTPVVLAQESPRVEMDRAGYFVILQQPANGSVLVEHYAYDNRLLRVIEGHDAKSIYSTIIKNGWVTQLGHAAYLGKELTRAELSLRLGFKFVQDGA
jgi:tetrahydromethanopterin S-methyltransferase subunit A